MSEHQTENEVVLAFDFDKAASIRQAELAVEEARFNLRTQLTEFHNEGSLDFFLERKQELTENRARQFMYFVAEIEGEPCICYVKGNAEVSSTGKITATAYFWETDYVIHLSQILRFVDTVEEADAIYAEEEAAYEAALAEEARLAEEAEAEKLAEKERKKAEKAAARQAAADEKAAARQAAKEADNGEPEGIEHPKDEEIESDDYDDEVEEIEEETPPAV